MHIGKLPLQPALDSQMYGQRCSGLPQPAGADVMVHRQNLGNANYALVNSTFFFFFPPGFVRGPYNTKPVSQTRDMTCLRQVYSLVCNPLATTNVLL